MQTNLPDGDVADVKVLHVVRALHVVVDHSFTCAAKGLDGVNFSLLQVKPISQCRDDCSIGKSHF